MKLSVLIPTYNRPGFLQEAVTSIWLQRLLPDEIVISDDSNNNETALLVNEKLMAKSPVPIRYFHHKPALKQAKNVDFLIRMASFECFILLHDDDLLMPDCLKILKKPLLDHPQVVASFGNQFLIRENGEIIQGSDQLLNKKYYRTPDRKGLVDGAWAATVQMLPNDGFMVRTKIAREVGYFDHGRAGDAVDFYFGFRLGKNRFFYWIDEVTSKYRIGQESITGSGSVKFMSAIVKILLEDLDAQQLDKREIKKKIKELMNPAISEVIRGGDKRTAIKWIFSSYYNVFTLRGIKRLLMILLPTPTSPILK